MIGGAIIANIKKIREERGLTQEYMASVLGITRATYNNIENGRRDITFGEMNKIKDVLGLTWFQILNPSIEGGERNEEKFEQMYMYILKKHFAKDGVPKTKLAKLLYLIDFTTYYDTQKSMSGVLYIRRDYGPVADIFFAMTDDLFDAAKINIEPVDSALIISATSVDEGFDLLSDDEKAMIDKVCEYWKNRRTGEIVNFTHSQKPWQACRTGEEIPYSLIIQEDPNHVYAPIAA